MSKKKKTVFEYCDEKLPGKIGRGYLLFLTNFILSVVLFGPIKTGNAGDDLASFVVWIFFTGIISIFVFTLLIVETALEYKKH
jgi:uncharacterized membrane protein